MTAARQSTAGSATTARGTNSASRQEKLARQTCARLGLSVEDRHVYVDNSRSAWKRNRKRPGWDALLAAVAAREVTHIVCYDPDRLMRQPRDLEDLLDAADQGVEVVGHVGGFDLRDANACGAPMYGNGRAEPARRGIGPLARYKCARSRGGCGRLSIDVDKVEAHIGRLVTGWLTEWERGAAMAKRDEEQRAHEAMHADRERMSELAAEYGAGRISMAEWKAARAPIEARLKELRKVRATRPTASIGPDEWGANAERAWRDADPPRRNALVATFVEAILIRRATAQGGTFDPSRVQIVPHPVDCPEPPPDDDEDEGWLTTPQAGELPGPGAAP